jgi:hypothetical protein
MKRFVDLPPGDDGESRAGELLRQASTPPHFGANDQARVREALRQKLRRPRRRAWLFPTVAFGMAALSLTVIAWLRFRLPSESPVQIAVVGNGAAEVDPARPRHVTLRNGRLAVRTAEEGAVVDAPRARVLVAPSSTVEITVREAGLVVAAYVGEAKVEYEESRIEQRVAAGSELDATGTHAIVPTRAGEIEAALEGKPLPAPAVEPKPEPPAPSVPPAPPVAPPVAVEPKPEPPAPVEKPRKIVRASVEQAKVVETETDEPMPSQPAPAPEPAVVAPAPVVVAPAPAPVAVAPAPAPVVVAPAPPPAPVAAPAPAPVVVAPTPAPAPAPPPESALSKESRALSDAVRLLRRDRDAAGALAALDEYRARWPKGVLRPEADVARVDALLSLGRRGDALAALESVYVASLPRARELTVVRGELRAEAGRCKQAARDFDVAAALGDALGERALWGRAGCRARLGDRDGARADLERYLERFPSGKFASEARRALAE